MEHCMQMKTVRSDGLSSHQKHQEKIMSSKACESCGCDPCDCDWGLYDKVKS